MKQGLFAKLKGWIIKVLTGKGAQVMGEIEGDVLREVEHLLDPIENLAQDLGVFIDRLNASILRTEIKLSQLREANQTAVVSLSKLQTHFPLNTTKSIQSNWKEQAQQSDKDDEGGTK